MIRSDGHANRFDPFSIESNAIKALVAFEASSCLSGLEEALLTLVKLKVSMILGSPFCIDRYLHEAVANGEGADRLAYLGSARIASMFTDRERAAVEWAEIVALAGETQVPDEAYKKVSALFAPEHLVALTAAVAAATAWNQIGLSFRLRGTMTAARL